MPNSKSAPYLAFALLGATGLWLAPACSGLLVTPGGSAGTAGTTGTAGSGSSSGSAGVTGAAGRGGSGGTVSTGGSGVAGSAGTAAASGTAGTTGAAGTGAAGRGGATGAAGAGSGGTTGTAGAAGTTPPRGPTPAMPGVNFPFPQNRAMSGCVLPTGNLNADVTAAYAQWKADTITSNGAGGFRRVQRTSSDGVSVSTPAGSTVSEGIGYGMIIAVYMNDQALFDDLWKYEQLWKNANGLMDWSINAAGTMRAGMGAATDADEDMAFALLMADKQWGGQGTLSQSYLAYAKTQIAAIWNHEIYQSKLAGPGDSWGPTDLWGYINISYFAPAYYRLFKQVDPDTTHAWDAVITTVYDTIKAALNTTNKNASNGLVPAWCTSTGGASSGQPFNYQYDSCRTPFRIGLDWCWNGEAQAQSYVAKTSTFFGGIGAANIVDGYNLDGTVSSGTHAVTAGQSASFVGPAAVGAMSDPKFQSFLDAAYARVATRQLLVGGAYYDESWAVMSMLMMTGNFLNYSAIEPAH